jgi:hypothetical protein
MSKCWNTAAVARPQSFSPYTGVAGVLGCRRCRSRLPSVLEHDDPSSRLSISLRIFRVFGSIEFSRLCIYMGPVARQVEHHQATQAIQSILCCAYVTTFIVIFITGLWHSPRLVIITSILALRVLVVFVTLEALISRCRFPGATIIIPFKGIRIPFVVRS